MSLKDKINNDLKDAMRSGDKLRLSTIRSLRALILNFEKSGVGREQTSDEELALLTSAAKKRKESIEQFNNAGRNELAEKEKALNDQKISHLVALYSAMDPAKAAVIMEKLKTDTVARILAHMKGKSAGKIMAMMKPERGAVVSERLSQPK